ncbi:hypothetical protein QZH56_35590 [Streptomyces olivoreticuli]|nr:hypothetical protein [Streptomyces olivoreticuli]WKK23949.1 hypothetical protein QZH56_35590 [Streptomyces olivoreticuli]
MQVAYLGDDGAVGGGELSGGGAGQVVSLMDLHARDPGVGGGPVDADLVEAGHHDGTGAGGAVRQPGGDHGLHQFVEERRVQGHHPGRDAGGVGDPQLGHGPVACGADLDVFHRGERRAVVDVVAFAEVPVQVGRDGIAPSLASEGGGVHRWWDVARRQWSYGGTGMDEDAVLAAGDYLGPGLLPVGGEARGDLGFGLQGQRCLDVQVLQRDLVGAEDLCAGREEHLGEAGSGQHRDTGHLVVGEPGQSARADRCLPQMPSGRIGIVHVAAQQRMLAGSHQVRGDEPVGSVVAAVAGAVPGGGGQVGEMAVTVAGGEVDPVVSGAVHGREMGQECLGVVCVLAQGADCHRIGDAVRLGGVQDRAHRERVWGALDEQPVPGGQCRRHGGTEVHCAALVAHPVGTVQRPGGQGVLADGGEEAATGHERGQAGECGGQVIKDGVDLCGVRGHVDIDRPGCDAVRVPCPDQSGDLRGVSGDDGGRGRGEHGERDSVGSGCLDRGLDLVGAQQHRGHRAAGDGGQQRGAAADDPHPVLAAECPGHHGGGHLAQGLPDHRGRFDAPGPPQRCQRDLDAEQDRLNLVDAPQPLRCGEHLAQGDAGLGLDQWFQFVDGGGEHRLVGQEASAHAGPLGALAGEHEHRPGMLRRQHRHPADRPVRLLPGGERPCPGGEVTVITGDQAEAVVGVAAAHGQGVGRIRQYHRPALFAVRPVGQAGGGRGQ